MIDLVKLFAGRAFDPPSASPSVVRVLKAMNPNEDRFEAVNSYDGSTLSFGILQWTAGAKDAAGELPSVLDARKTADRAASDDCFGVYRLDAETDEGEFTGRFILDGRRLSAAENKAVLGGVDCTYRFWRAGHVQAVRAAQFELAAARVLRFSPVQIEGRPLRAWTSSERAIALVLDEHVNRPSNVPRTLASAVKQHLADQELEPEAIDDNTEKSLIDLYLASRAETSMTSSDDRAARIDAAVASGELSPLRRSFVP